MPSLIELAARFPLVPRRRPAAGPIDARAKRLAGLAAAAHRDQDADRASTAFNGAALLASDCGAADLAADWCRWHASLYLDRPRLDAHALRFALEPVVNLARLRTRAGDGIGAHQLLADLHHAVTHRTATTIDGLEVRADAWGADITQQPELTQWLRSVLITDGTRALVTARRWTPAADHARRYGGLTAQLHDGRQVAVLAALVADDDTATELIRASVPEQPWEHAIRAVLLAMCNEPTEISGEQRRTLLALAAAAPELAPGNGLAVYRTRLGLTTIDLAAAGSSDDSQQHAHRLCADALADQDGHAVKDLLDHHAVPTAPDCDLWTFYERCGLHRGELPAAVLDNLQHALRLAAGTIQLGA